MAALKAGKWTYTGEQLERMFEEADKRGKERLKKELRAGRAEYDPQSRRLVIDLLNGCVFIVPVDLMQGLRGATDEGLRDFELMPRGFRSALEEAGRAVYRGWFAGGRLRSLDLTRRAEALAGKARSAGSVDPRLWRQPGECGEEGTAVVVPTLWDLTDYQSDAGSSHSTASLTMTSATRHSTSVLLTG